MTNVTVYDIEARKIEEICEEKDTTSAELIEALLQAVEDGEIELDDYL